MNDRQTERIPIFYKESLTRRLLIAWALFLTLPPMATPANVEIPCPRLRTAVNSALGKGARTEITSTELATLQRLDAPESGIRELTGLEFAVNATELHLGRNQIADVSPLKDLTKLKVLDLHRNWRLQEISPLKNLKNLTWLSLRGNRISDVSPLKNLTRLTYLHLAYNQNLSDISPLKHITNLRVLDLDDNRISDISALLNMIHLTNELDLDGNQISDISPLKNMRHLKELDLDGNVIKDVSVLGALRNLEVLDLHDNNISDISGLKNLVNLKDLDLDDNQISDVSALRALTNLTILDLDGNLIKDISPLGSLVNLSVLDLHDNCISDFSPIAELIAGLEEYDNSDQKQPPVSKAVNGEGVLAAPSAHSPKRTALLANYPNPFNPETWIPYHLAEDADVSISIYSSMGERIRVLTLGEQPAGIYESRRDAAYWDGRNQWGERVASGVYFYTLSAGDFTATRKLLIKK